MFRFVIAISLMAACYNLVYATGLDDGIVALNTAGSSSPPDYALYSSSTANRFDIYDGETGASAGDVRFFSTPWASIAAASLADGNSDGMADDAALVVLGRNTGSGQIKVQSRDVASGNVIHNIVYFNSTWTPLAVAVLDDANGDGSQTDPAAAVLAQSNNDGRIMVELRRLNDGTRLGRWRFFSPDWTAKSVVAFVPQDGVPRVAVLGTDPESGHSKVWVQPINGAAMERLFFYGADVDTRDVGVVADIDGNGTADDTGLVVLGRKSNGRIVARIRRLADGSIADDLLLLGSTFDAHGFAVIGDTDSNGFDDVAVLAAPVGGGNLMVRLRDLGTGATIDNIEVDKVVASNTLFADRSEDIYLGDTFTPAEVSTDVTGKAIIRTLQVVRLAPDATTADVDDFLSSYNAVITGSVAGSTSMVVRIPDPGSLVALQAIQASMLAESFVDAVYSDRIAQTRELPPNVTPGSDSDYAYIEHQLAIGSGAAWNARAAVTDEPNVLLADYFGVGSTVLSSFVDADLLAPGAASAASSDDHGYHVAGILAGSFGGSGTLPGLVSGVIPETVDLNILDLETGISSANTDVWILATARTRPGTVIVSLSLGADCVCQEINPSNLCRSPDVADQEAITWIDQVRGAGLENKLLQISAASNRDSGETWQPACTNTTETYALRDAGTSSHWNTAALTSVLWDTANDRLLQPLNNALVVENLRHNGPAQPAQQRSEVLCLDENSFVGGNISAIGTDVQSLTRSGVDAFSGTSMATPQVAGLAAYLLAIDPSLSPQKIIELLDATGVTPGTTGSPLCSDWQTPAKAIDAYAALLALDEDQNPTDARVRLAILDVVDSSGAAGTADGKFDEHDLAFFVAAIDNGSDLIAGGDVTVRYSRTDLNGDGYDGGVGNDFSARFNLDIDYPPSYETISRNIEGLQTRFDETGATDFEVLCYYAYSDLYTGSESERRRILGPRCGGMCIAEAIVSGRREASFIGPAYFMELQSGWTLGLSSHEWHNGWDPDMDGVIDDAYTAGFGAFPGALPEPGTEVDIPNVFALGGIVRSLTLTDFWQFGTIEECTGCGGTIRVNEYSEDGNTMYGEIDFIGSDSDSDNPGISRLRVRFEAARDIQSEFDTPYEQCSTQWWLIDP